MGLRTMLGLKRRSEPTPAHITAVSAQRTARKPPKIGPPSNAPDMAPWFAGKAFTTDWTSHKLGPWFTVFGTLRDADVDVLELGTYEGRSAVVFLEYFRRSRVTCVDTFAAIDITSPPESSKAVEERFDANMAAYGDRVIKVKQRAAVVLDRLTAERASFDVIYIDAGKGRHGVFALSVLAWPLLRIGGHMIWDDLKWGRDRAPEKRPAGGIELFRDTFRSCLDVIHEDKQLIARKTSEWPTDRA